MTLVNVRAKEIEAMATWRVGRKLGRTLYKDDACVGMVDTPELATLIVETMNGDEMRKKYKADWRCHTTVAGDTDRRTAWGMWQSGPHVGLHLSDLYPTRAEALSAAREMLGKQWADLVVVRKVTLGPVTTMKAR